MAMKFNLAKTAAIISAARIAAGAAAGNPADAAQVADAAGIGSSVYDKRTASDLRRVAAYSGIVAAMKFASAPAVAALPACAALFMATFAVIALYAAVLHKSPLDTSVASALLVTGIFGVGLASVICALNLAVGHPLDVSLWALAVKVFGDCIVYLVLCWICDKVLRKCRRLV